MVINDRVFRGSHIVEQGVIANGPAVSALVNLGDLDQDGSNDLDDAFPLHRDEYRDDDRDGIGNNADTDDDGDGIADTDDHFPLLAAEWRDYDIDMVGDVADFDDDNDGVSDWMDAYPLDRSRQMNPDDVGRDPEPDEISTSGGGGGAFAIWAFILTVMVSRSSRKLKWL